MYKKLTSFLAGAALMIVASGALATSYTIEGNDIGSLDTLIASGNVNSGDQSEVSWVNSSLHAYYGVTFNFTTDDLAKYNTPEGIGWRETDQYTSSDPVVAYALQTAPEFYYIKTGNVGTNDHFLFANDESFDWAVLNLDTSFGDGYEILGIGKFSHNGELGDTTPVPEPGTMVLLGAGLLGLAVFGKRRMNRA